MIIYFHFLKQWCSDTIVMFVFLYIVLLLFLLKEVNNNRIKRVLFNYLIKDLI